MDFEEWHGGGVHPYSGLRSAAVQVAGAERFVQEVAGLPVEPGQVSHVLPNLGVIHTVHLDHLGPGHLLPVQEADVALHGGHGSSLG